MLTDEELLKLEELEEKATPGPWEWFASDGPTPHSFINDVLNATEKSGKFIPNVHGCQVQINGEDLTTVITGCGPTSPDNAKFLTWLRNAAKSLLQSARREKEYRAALEKIATYKKRNDSESDGQTIISLQVIAEEAINPTKLVFSEALKKGDQ